MSKVIKSPLSGDKLVGSQPRWKKTIKYTLYVIVAGTIVFPAITVLNIYSTVLARKYATEEDMREWRSMDRNILAEDIPEEIANMELLHSELVVDTHIFALFEKRENLPSADIKAARSSETKKEVYELLKTALFGSQVEQKRAWNDHYSFYFTDKELTELSRLRNQGIEWGSKEAPIRKW